MARRTAWVTAVGFTALAGFGVGCGGSAASAESPPAERARAAAKAPAPARASRTRADLVTDARRICARLDGRMRSVVGASRRPPARRMRAILDAWAATVADLHDLRPPADEKERFQRMLAHFDTAIRAGRAFGGGSGETAFVQFAAMADAGMKGASIADRYDLLTCSIFPPAPTRAEFERYVLEQARAEGGLLGPGPARRLRPASIRDGRRRGQG